MEIIQLALAAIIFSFVYKKMTKNVALSKKQKYLPILFGIISTFLSFLFVLAIALLFIKLGFNKESVENPLAVSIMSAFWKAGLTEEFAKLLMIILSIKLFKPKNVYEYALIGAAVGIGFTLHEEFLYGGSLVGFTRFLTLFIHMALGVIMGKYIGIGMYNKKNGGEYKKYYALSVIIPIAVHTIYDACTVYNIALKEGDNLDENTLAVGLLAGVLCVLCAMVWQWIVIRKLKNNSANYLSMSLSYNQRQ